MVASTVSERYARKKSFILLGAIGLVGALLQACSTINFSRETSIIVASFDRCLTSLHLQVTLFIVGKIVLNLSVGIASAVVPTYLAESSPASLRGVLSSVYAVIQNVGAITATITVYFVVERMVRLDAATSGRPAVP